MFLKVSQNKTDQALHHLIIQPGGNLDGNKGIIGNLADNRFLIRELVSRDLRSRYIGSYLGLFWSVLNPLIQLALYTVVFSYILGIRFEREASVGNFAIYLFCALLPWTAIQESTSRSAVCFLEHSNLIKKMRFSLESLPFSLVVSSLIHQLIGILVFSVVLVISGTLSFQTLPFLIPLLLVQMVMMVGMAMIFACLNVFFRDVVQVMNVLFMMLFWGTPIVYPRSMVPDNWLHWILDLNPFTHMVEAFRFAFLGVPVEPVGVVYWLIFSLIIFFFGRLVLKRTRHQLLDLI
jgi:ABC-type polysaccharide/polyol phosphate export permease